MENEQLMEWPELSIEETNTIQLDLARKSGEDTIKWIEENSENFRKYITVHPDIVRLYKENPKDAEEVIKKALEESPDEPIH